MKAPARPENEPERLRLLDEFQILDTEAEQSFDDLVKVAAAVFDAPIALVSLVDERRQWFKARVGLEATETSREVSFCGHAVADNQLLVVPDATADERFFDNPLVTGEPHVLFYVGEPIRTPEGAALGTLCVIDHKPRPRPTEKQLEALRALSRQTMAQLQLRRFLKGTEGELRSLREEHAVLSARVTDVLGSEDFRPHLPELDLICVATPDGWFRKLSPGWEKALGYTLEELKREPFLDFVHPNDRDATVREMKLLGQPGHQTVSFGNRYRAKDGSYRWLLWNAAADPKTGEIVASARDYTERQRIEEMKSSFVSVASHELRTPLTSIRGALGLILGGAVGELPLKAQKLLAMADKNSIRLARLIDDLLDIEKIESGRIELQRATLDLSEVAAQSVSANEAFAKDKGKRIELVATSVDVSADADRLLQVLDNLLSNAVKYGAPKGLVTVTVHADDSEAVLRVHDDGPGVPADFRDKIFRRFERAARHKSTTQGTGLGLAITKAIVEMHGGRIGLTSEEARGTTFEVRLPRVARANQVAQARTSRHALIVEDDADVAELIRMMLAEEGVSSDLVSNATNAEVALRTGEYQLATVDLGLPDEGGLKLIARLRAEGVELPALIVVSADADERTNQIHGTAIGVLDWIPKPIDEGRLRQLVRTARPPGKKPRALYLEDDRDLAEVTALSVADCVDVVHAASLAEARERLREGGFDLVILDLSLPDGPAADLLPLLSQAEPPIPIIIYSGDPRGEVIQQAQVTVVKARGDRQQLRAALTATFNQLHRSTGRETAGT